MSALTCTLGDQGGSLRSLSPVPAIIRPYLPGQPGSLITWQIGNDSKTIYTEGTPEWEGNKL